MSGNSPARVISAVLVGTTVEFYDFFIYGTAAALVFGHVFFPQLTPLNGLLAAFSVYAVGFLGRPTGAAVFGYLGDRIGRRRALIGSLLLMGVCTTVVGLLPDYSDWGIWAPVSLTALRYLQGVGLGGEFGGASLMATEHAPPGRRGLYGACVPLGPCLGFALATGMFWTLSVLLTGAQMQAWGWRLPFLASVVLVAFGLFARLRVAETPAFVQLRAQEAQTDRAEPSPLSTVCRGHWRALLLGAGSVMTGSVLFYITTVWSLSHAANDLHVPSTRMLGLLMVANVFLGAGTFLGALLSDRYGRRRVVLGGTLAALVWSPLLVPLLDTGRVPLMLLGLAGAMAVLGTAHGPIPAFLPELFPPAVRCSGASLSYNIGTLCGGALAPLIATRITASIGSYAVGWYLVAVCLGSLLCVRALPRVGDQGLLFGATPEAISTSGP
jgi:metabolite-proton symporter